MSEKILIVDDDLDTVRLVGLMLEKKGYQIRAANNGRQGLQKAEEEIPDLILLDVMMPDMDGYEVARRLRAKPETAGIPILMFTAKSQLDDKVTGFEAGIDDYLTKPTHPTELYAHVKALLSRSIKPKKEDLIPEEEPAYTVGVLSARGGLGVSSVALNLSSYLSTNMNEETILVEMSSGTGTIGRDLGFSTHDSLTNLLKKSPSDITKRAVENALQEHKTGVQLLLASEQPKDMLLNHNAISEMEVVFSQLREIADFLIADFGAGVPSLSQKLLPECDQIVVVVDASSNSVAHAKILLENLLELGIKKQKLLVVLNNRMRSDSLLSASKVESQIDHPVAVTFTPAPELFSQAINMNTTAVLQDPKSLTAQQFQKMTAIIFANEAKK